jgi:hypothetical protein
MTPSIGNANFSDYFYLVHSYDAKKRVLLTFAGIPEYVYIVERNGYKVLAKDL